MRALVAVSEQRDALLLIEREINVYINWEPINPRTRRVGKQVGCEKQHDVGAPVWQVCGLSAAVLVGRCAGCLCANV